ncbi:hypothetical protein BJX99DRAFT_264305 [Aspergillus californicus]
MATLPQELLYLVAQHLHQDGVSLVPYSTVCRHWQPIFESLIFSTLIIHSGNASDDNKLPGQKGISLGQFEEATSGPNATRRAYIHNLQYDVLVPFELLDWTARKEAGYTTKNPIRKANDEAFAAAMTSLFQVLSSWDERIHLSLQVGLLGRRQGRELEPLTRYFSNAGDYRYDYRNGRTKSVPPYRARFSGPNIVLSSVSCVDKLTFANIRFRVSKMSEDRRVDSDEDETETRPRNRWHQVWASAVYHIARHCPTMTELYVDLNDWVRPDHLPYIKERRTAVAEGLQALPASLRVLDYTGQQEYPWKETQPALNVLKTETDTLATSLQSISLVLRELRLTNATLPMDFLWPLDDSRTYHWPYLKVLILDEVPPFLPSGKWLADPEASDQEEIANISDWEDEICNYERGFVDRPVQDTEQFHRLFTSWGHAARNGMPQIASMKFSLDHSPSLRFSFSVAGDAATLEWVTGCAYRLDRRVARAWGFDVDELGMDELGFDEEEFSVALPRWPLRSLA